MIIVGSARSMWQGVGSHHIRQRVTLPDRIFRTPYQQRLYNIHGNDEFDQIFRLGLPKIRRYPNVDNDMLIKCLNAVVPIMCHFKFPSCEGTKSQYKKQKDLP